MIAQFHQSKSHPTCEYEIIGPNGQVLGSAVNADGRSAVLHLAGEEYELRLMLKKSVGSDGALQLRHLLFVNGAEYGAVEPRSNVRKVRFLKYEGYHYQVFPVGDRQFELCEVGFGADEHYFCLHCGGETAAVVHMSDYERDYCNDYTIYAGDKTAFAAACIAILYKEAVRYNNRDADTTRPFAHSEMTKTKPYNTPDPSLRARFDPDFIPRIRARYDQK